MKAIINTITTKIVNSIVGNNDTHNAIFFNPQANKIIPAEPAKKDMTGKVANIKEKINVDQLFAAVGESYIMVAAIKHGIKP